jgi:hypothetical protein
VEKVSYFLSLNFKSNQGTRICGDFAPSYERCNGFEREGLLNGEVVEVSLSVLRLSFGVATALQLFNTVEVFPIF